MERSEIREGSPTFRFAPCGLQHYAASADRARFAISPPFFRFTSAMSYWLCKSSQNCTLLRAPLGRIARLPPPLLPRALFRRIQQPPHRTVVDRGLDRRGKAREQRAAFGSLGEGDIHIGRDQRLGQKREFVG
jgi:hypothetical protein